MNWFPTSTAEDAVDPAVEPPPKEVVLEIDDADPLRLVDVEDDPPPKPEKPSFAGLDSSGKSSPVRVILLNHILRYLPLPPSSLRFAPTAAALALLSCKLSPWNKGQKKDFETEVAIWTFPATEVGARRRIMYLLGLVRGVSAAFGLSGARWSSACGVGGRTEGGLSISEVRQDKVLKIQSQRPLLLNR